MTAWGAGSLVQMVSTIQSSRTAETVADQKQAVSAGILDAYFSVPGLCRQSRPLGWIFGRRSLCPKIPFPAAPFRATQGRLAIWKFGILRQKTPFPAGSRLLWVQSERLELPAPFCRSITKSFDSDAAEQSAFARRSDEIRGEEGE